MVGQGKLGQVEPDKALEEEPGGSILYKGALLLPDSGVPKVQSEKVGQAVGQTVGHKMLSN